MSDVLPVDRRQPLDVDVTGPDAAADDDDDDNDDDTVDSQSGMMMSCCNIAVVRYTAKFH